MSSKKCSYKGCDTFTNSSRPSSETFYSFPKHPERLKLWMKLGGCLNEKEISSGSRYFCSKHFDEAKYVANNPRRKQLLSTAIPYPCTESFSQNISVDDENDFQCVVSSVHIIDENDAGEEDELQDGDIVDVSNGMNLISESIEELETYEEYHEPDEINVPSDYEEDLVQERTLKRKIDTSTKQSPINESKVFKSGPLRKTATIVSNRPTSTRQVFQRTQNKESNVELDEHDTNTLTPSSNQTTFIFKGEEYIQMPLEEYNREKIALTNKLKTYEEILKSVKHLLDSAKIKL